MTDPLALRRRRLNGLPVERPRVAPLAKRIALSPWTWVFVVATLLYAGVLAWELSSMMRPVRVEGGEVSGVNASAIRQAARLALPTVAVWLALYVLLDRFRPQRPLFWWLALGWGASIATAASLVVNTWAAQEMNIGGSQNDPATGARAAVFVAPFVEEAAKASVLFLIALAHRYRLVSVVSGAVLAGLSAAGFAFVENILYYARAIVYSSQQIGVGDPDAAIRQIVLLRGVLTAFGHPLFTTMTGIGVIVAVRTHSKVVRVAAPLAGYLVAALMHMGFNAGASFVTDPQQQLFVYVLVILPLVLSAAVWIVRRVPAEGRRLRSRLDDYVRAGWLSEGDAYALARQRSRWYAVLVAATRGPRALLATWRVQRAATELAYLRDAVTRGTVDAAGDGRARELLDAIAALRPLAVVDPRGLRPRGPNLRLLLARLRSLRLPGRRAAAQLQPNAPVGAASAPLGSSGYSAVDPRWGPPRP